MLFYASMIYIKPSVDVSLKKPYKSFYETTLSCARDRRWVKIFCFLLFPEKPKAKLLFKADVLHIHISKGEMVDVATPFLLHQTLCSFIST